MEWKNDFLFWDNLKRRSWITSSRMFTLSRETMSMNSLLSINWIIELAAKFQFPSSSSFTAWRKNARQSVTLSFVKLSSPSLSFEHSAFFISIFTNFELYFQFSFWFWLFPIEFLFIIQQFWKISSFYLYLYILVRFRIKIKLSFITGFINKCNLSTEIPQTPGNMATKN